MSIIKMKKVQNERIALTEQESKKIKKLYEDAANSVSERIKFFEKRENISSIMRTVYLKELSKELEASMLAIDSEIENDIKSNIKKVSSSVVYSNQNLLKNIGFSEQLCSTAYLYVPDDIVKIVSTGKLYEGKWTLSSAIWGDNKKKIEEINSIVAKGIAENKSTYEIAKDLERYVNPNSIKMWDWSKVYPGTRKVIDYNAQRLSRTMISHAYQESFVRTTINNPFIESYKWLISNSDRVCPLCQDRATLNQFGLGNGIYPKNVLPLDHPNGMCTFSVVIQKSEEQIAIDLANWVNGKGDKKLNSNIDKFVKDFQKSS